MNISGGEVGYALEARGGSTVNISGGVVGDFFDAESGSVVNISGGIIGDVFEAYSGSQVHLFGTQFILDGFDITATLATGIPSTISDRNVTLAGMFADGSEFSFDLNSSLTFSENLFRGGALLTVTLVGPGDFNGDLKVDGSDFLKWQRVGGTAGELADWEAFYGTDLNITAGTTVPEPSISALALVALCLTLGRRRSAIAVP